MLHDHLSWKPHVEKATAKAQRVVKLATVMTPNHAGLGMVKRRLLAAIADSIVKYAAPIWTEAVKLQWCKRKLEQLQRPLAKGVARTFRTVKYTTAVVLAGLISLRLQVLDMARRHKRHHEALIQGVLIDGEVIKRLERLATMKLWQTSWDEDAAHPSASRFVRWVHRVLPDIAGWVGRKHGEVEFHLSQVLSGHGLFREYLHTLGFASAPTCPFCANNVVVSAELVMFVCPRFANVRVQLLLDEEGVAVSPERLMPWMLASPDSWQAAAEAARRVCRFLQLRWLEDQATENAAVSADIQAAAQRVNAVTRANVDDEESNGSAWR